MRTSTRTSKMLYIIGAILAIAGSFLPWRVWGDLIPYWENGIDFDRLEIHECFQVEKLFKGLYYCPVEDNGGFLVLLLSATVLILVFRRPASLKRPFTWIVICAATPALLSTYYLGDVLIQRLKFTHMIGAAEPQIGLFMVLLGSLLMLSLAIRDYRRSRTA